MPAKFVVQMKTNAYVWDRGFKRRDAWIDTQWPSVVKAKQHWPDREYREVMTEW